MSVAIAIVHPEQYALTRASLSKLGALPHVCEYIRHWAFGFNVLTVVVNRDTLVHRDKQSGGLDWLDELLSIRGSDDTVLELPGVGARFLYQSGTIALFSGNIFSHGVSCLLEERVCFAAYVRPSVHRAFKIHSPHPPTISRSLHHTYWAGYIQTLITWSEHSPAI